MSSTTTEDAERLLRIGEMAERTGVSERTLRYYEEIDLLSPAGHSPGGSRRYGEAQIARVARIRELQQLLGLNLDEIRTTLSAEDRLDALRAAWHEHQDPALRTRIVQKSIAINTSLREEVAAKQARIAEFLAEVDARLDRNRRFLAELASEGEGAGRDPGSVPSGSTAGRSRRSRKG